MAIYRVFYLDVRGIPHDGQEDVEADGYDLKGQVATFFVTEEANRRNVQTFTGVQKIEPLEEG